MLLNKLLLPRFHAVPLTSSSRARKVTTISRREGFIPQQALGTSVLDLLQRFGDQVYFFADGDLRRGDHGGKRSLSVPLEKADTAAATRALSVSSINRVWVPLWAAGRRAGKFAALFLSSINQPPISLVPFIEP